MGPPQQPSTAYSAGNFAGGYLGHTSVGRGLQAWESMNRGDHVEALQRLTKLTSSFNPGGPVQDSGGTSGIGKSQAQGEDEGGGGLGKIVSIVASLFGD